MRRFGKQYLVTLCLVTVALFSVGVMVSFAMDMGFLSCNEQQQASASQKAPAKAPNPTAAHCCCTHFSSGIVSVFESLGIISSRSTFLPLADESCPEGVIAEIEYPPQLS